MIKIIAALPLALMLAGCGPNTSERFARFSEDFVQTSLAFSPSAATAAGLHQYNNQNLDDMLDDVGPEAIETQRRFYRESQRKSFELAAEDRADFTIIRDQISLALLELDEIQNYKHNPATYVETYGNAIFAPYQLQYAPLPARIRNIISRLKQTSRFLEQAQANLVSAPEIWTKVALEENQGNVQLVGKTIRDAVPAELRSEYDAAAAPALEAMARFHEFLTRTLAGKNDADWRLGAARYARKFAAVLETGVEPATLLQRAEQELKDERARMFEMALPLHRQMLPAHKDHAELAGEERENRVIGEVLDRIAQRHATPATYLEQAARDLDEARAFVQRKGLLTFPARGNLTVIPTPEFMRGVYSVGGFNPAPALEPQLGAFYWVTPVPADWPKARAESKLREYNFYGLKILTLHEAVPGHWLQFEFANDVQPKGRRLLRALYGNGPYVEGWAVYSSKMMLEEGYLDNNPEMALTFAKQYLRVLANTIIDIRLQTMNMTGQEAVDLMEKRTFQEKEEAEGKLQRAMLTSCQLPVYFAGYHGWMEVRDAYKKAKGAAFRLAEFHDRALKEGAVPLKDLGSLIQ